MNKSKTQIEILKERALRGDLAYIYREIEALSNEVCEMLLAQIKPEWKQPVTSKEHIDVETRPNIAILNITGHDVALEVFGEIRLTVEKAIKKYSEKGN